VLVDFNVLASLIL